MVYTCILLFNLVAINLMKITAMTVAVSTLSIVWEPLFQKRQAQGGPEAAVADLVTCFGKVLLHNLNCHNLLLGCGSGSAARQLFVITGRGGGSRLLVRGSPGVRAMGQSLGLGATLPPRSCPSSLLSACHLILQGGFCCWLWGMWEYL